MPETYSQAEEKTFERQKNEHTTLQGEEYRSTILKDQQSRVSGKIHGELRASGLVIRPWTQFIGYVSSIDENRVIISREQRVVISTDGPELERFDFHVGDNITVTVGEQYEIFIQ